MNDWLAAADVFVTDQSSSIYELALLRRPLVLVVAGLEADEWDLAACDAFVARHLEACDGHASERFIERFIPRRPA